FFFFFQAEDGIRDRNVTGVQTCALPISSSLIAREPSAARAVSSDATRTVSSAERTSSAFARNAKEPSAIEHMPTSVAFSSSLARSEERRVGKECRSRWPPEQ